MQPLLHRKLLNVHRKNTVYTDMLVIDHTKCGGSDSVNFPVYVDLTDARYKCPGGLVSSNLGYDIIFTSDAAGLNRLNWEMIYPKVSLGIIKAFVMLPTVSHTVDTVFYMHYGDRNITTFQGNTAGTWNSNYKSVYHFVSASNPAPNFNFDSTANANALTTASVTGGALPGKIGGGNSALVFNGTTDFMAGNDAIFPAGTSSRTVSLWLNPTSVAPAMQAAFCYGDTRSGYFQVGLLGSLSHIQTELGDVSSGSVIAGTWNLITATYDSRSFNQQLYVNGALKITSSLGTLDTLLSGFFIGKYVAAAGYYGGGLQEVKISDDVKSADWVLTEYNNQNNPSTFITVTHL